MNSNLAFCLVLTFVTLCYSDVSVPQRPVQKPSPRPTEHQSLLNQQNLQNQQSFQNFQNFQNQQNQKNVQNIQNQQGLKNQNNLQSQQTLKNQQNFQIFNNQQNHQSQQDRQNQRAVQNQPHFVRLVNYESEEEATSSDNPSSPEEILDIYFDFIKNNDENNCLMRLICQIGYNRTAFGNFGEQVASFFAEIQPNSGAAADYQEAFRTHEKEKSEAKCLEKYPNCQYETKDMIEVGNDLMTKNLTNLQLDEVQKGQVWMARIN